MDSRKAVVVLGSIRTAPGAHKRPVSARNGERSTRMVGKGRYVEPTCFQASNPYHRCTRNCLHRTAMARRRIKRAVQNGEISLEENMAVGVRKVDPMCVKASNPYHHCTDHCSQEISEARRQTKGGRSAKSMEAVKMRDYRKVDPTCMNASNPYHKCSEYCLQRSSNMGRIKRRKTVVIAEETKRHLKRVGRKNMNSTCPYGSNPYHTCAEYCLKRN